MFHRNLLGVIDPPPLFPTMLVAEPGTTCADPRCGSWFGRMAEQSSIKAALAKHPRCQGQTHRAVLCTLHRLYRAVTSLVFGSCVRLGGEGTKLLRDLVTTAAAKGQCSPHAVGGGPSWSECCCLFRQTLTCGRWGPELRSDLLQGLLCCQQRRTCAVSFGGASFATLM